MAKTADEIIGEAVLGYRRRAKLSQEALAERADIHPNYVGRIERGECSPTVKILVRIARALKVHPHKLFLKL
ncbi:helix-turn-helix domain-containing protein [bacterium]|nr:helix-turn-helix domain-containing protein [bacterium]